MGDKQWERLYSLYFPLLLSENHIRLFLTMRNLRVCLKKVKVDSVASGGPFSSEQYFVSFSLTISSEMTASSACSFSYSWFLFSSFHKSFWHPSSLVSYRLPLLCLVTWLGTCILRRKKLLSWPSPTPCIWYLISLWLFMTQLF